ncbi:MAG: TRAP transporter small permease [Ruminiclostridium sp.]|nr:TRAP transporter small permease [Ruminiclostridium sp.]
MPAILQKLSVLRPVYDITYKVILFICKLLLIGDIIITVWAVAGRYIPFISDPSWSEELVLTMMVYMAVLSAALAIRKRGHIRMTAFDKYISKTALKISDLIADIGVLVLGAVLLIYGIMLCASPLSELGRYISLPGLSKFWQYMSIPTAGAGMIIFELEQIVLRIGAFYEKEEKTDKKEEK